MKLLMISDLNGNRKYYEFLASQAERFDVMLWAGNLTSPYSDDPIAEQEFVERACGQIQAKGCRILAAGGESDSWASPWSWLARQGRFVAPGLFVTTLTHGGGERRDLALIREAAWSAGALWIDLSRGPVAPGLLTAGAPESMLLWPNVALRFGPDVIVSSHCDSSHGRNAEWVQRRGHTWIFTPGEGGDDVVPAYVSLDTIGWTAKRYSSAGTDRRNLAALRRKISTGSSPTTRKGDVHRRASRGRVAQLASR